MTDSEDYKQRREFFAGMLTIYGRKPVLDALEDPAIQPYRLHLADSNKHSKPIQAMLELAQSRGIETLMHSREALSRISKNRRQDQGVVLDIAAPNYRNVSVLNPYEHPCVIALENVTNPQNIGMTIRSIGASPAAGLILPKQGSAPLDALVIKASAGTLFKTPVFYCSSLLDVVPQLGALGYKIYGMTGAGSRALNDIPTGDPAIYLLGNETHGLSNELLALCDAQVKIPMRSGVESLNVSVAAALVAFRGVL
jgi:23S rRNA (guanosine2251-2'-O)-methyltransferase